LKLLNLKQVEYLVIGGWAVGFYGYPRATGDMDIWVSRTEENARKVLESLKEFGFNVPNLPTNLFTIGKSSYTSWYSTNPNRNFNNYFWSLV
jgi:hypothetical protein